MSRSSTSPLPHLSSAIDARLQLLHRLSATLNSTDRRAASRKLVAQGHPPKGRPRGSQMAPPDRHVVCGCTIFFQSNWYDIQIVFLTFLCLLLLRTIQRLQKTLCRENFGGRSEKKSPPSLNTGISLLQRKIAGGAFSSAFPILSPPFIWCASMWFDLFGQSVSGFVLINISFRLHEC